MPNSVRSGYYLRLGGHEVGVVPGSITQEEQLEGWTTYVLQFELSRNMPSGVSRGASVNADYTNMTEGIFYQQFKGTINDLPAVSFPNKQLVYCVGPLAKLRRSPSSDRNLTGYTDREAAQSILGFCGVAFNEVDVHGSNYVLGGIEDIIWHKDQDGWEILSELDRVFGYTTIELGNGRIVRFAYDKVPSASLIDVQFRRGDATRFYYNEILAGDTVDTIQNNWSVTGLSYECGPEDEKCQCQIYAKAKGHHDLLGEDRLAKTQEFSSDMIQDGTLAQQIAERMIRWYNRVAVNLRIETRNHQRILPGSIVGVYDTAPGIDIETLTPFLVTRIIRRGGLMELNCIGGPAGTFYSSMNGLERKCNKATSTPDAPETPSDPPYVIVPPYPPDAGNSKPTDGSVVIDAIWDCGQDWIYSATDWTATTGLITDG